MRCDNCFGFRTVALVVLAVAASWAPAYGHAVGAEATVGEDGRTITIETWLSGGIIPRKGTVIVMDENGAEIARGELREGTYPFVAPDRQRYRFNIQLGEGHARIIALSEEEYANLYPGTVTPAIEPTPVPAGIQSATQTRQSPGVPIGGIAGGIVIIGVLAAAGRAAGRILLVRRIRREAKSRKKDSHGPPRP